jgi:flagellar biosynthesis/type III secretory pathway chaperone
LRADQRVGNLTGLAARGPRRKSTHIAGRLTLFLVLVSLFAPPLFGKRDPLTEAEVNQIRDLAQEPQQRIRLYLKFLRARAEALDHLRLDPRFSADRNQKIHDLLDDITALLDELDDNLDQYAAQKADLRKPLQDVIEFGSDLQAKLRQLKQASVADARQAQSAKDYAFVLDSALDAASASLEHARSLEKEQQQTMKGRVAQKKK